LIKKHSKIYLAGHRGLVGSAILRKLKSSGFKNIITVTKKKLNLINQSKVENFIKKHKPDLVIIAAGKVGGILTNSKLQAEFMYENLMIECNLINASFKHKIKNLIFLGSSCVYPSNIGVKIKESDLLRSNLEKTNEGYAIAKIAGIKLCEYYNRQYNSNYFSLMPTNIYGPNDNYDPATSHFIAALIMKIYLAKKHKLKHILLWGDGKSKREIMYVDDLADAVIFFANKKPKHDLINIGIGKDMSIKDYAKKIMKIVNYNVPIKFDRTKPNGMRRKILDVSLANSYGWKSKTSLNNGIKKTYLQLSKYKN
tara:strand:- start:74 stop:1006 length:933 start_codon:yes stop_codon:yes gene_type:complete